MKNLKKQNKQKPWSWVTSIGQNLQPFAGNMSEKFSIDPESPKNQQNSLYVSFQTPSAVVSNRQRVYSHIPPSSIFSLNVFSQN